MKGEPSTGNDCNERNKEKVCITTKLSRRR